MAMHPTQTANPSALPNGISSPSDASPNALALTVSADAAPCNMPSPTIDSGRPWGSVMAAMP